MAAAPNQIIDTHLMMCYHAIFGLGTLLAIDPTSTLPALLPAWVDHDAWQRAWGVMRRGCDDQAVKVRATDRQWQQLLQTSADYNRRLSSGLKARTAALDKLIRTMLLLSELASSADKERSRNSAGEASNKLESERNSVAAGQRFIQALKC